MSRRGRRNRRNGATMKLHSRSNAVSGFNVPEQTRQYALNLIGTFELTEEFLGFILFQLNTNEREDIMNLFYENMKTKPEQNNFNNCRKSLHETEEVARFILEDIYDHKITFRKRELKNKIVLMLNKKKQNCKNSFKRELKDLQDIFQLDDAEISVISFLFCHMQDPSFKTLCDSHQFSSYLQLM